MIGRIRGLLIEKQLPFVLIELINGIAYDVEVPMSTAYQLPEIGSEIILYIHFTVREDAQLLYGFAQKKERLLFRDLIKVNGVGPKLALSILSSFEIGAFIQCINAGDVAALTKIPGVGKKTAERLVIEMRDRLSGRDDVAADAMPNLAGYSGASPINEAISGLIALGYKPQEASRAVSKLQGVDLSCEEIIRKALQGMIA